MSGLRASAPTVEVLELVDGRWCTVRLNEVRVTDRRRNAPAPTWSSAVERVPTETPPAQ
jgi:hypothetical protein